MKKPHFDVVSLFHPYTIQLKRSIFTNGAHSSIVLSLSFSKYRPPIAKKRYILFR
jgi:hypothetical protein